MLCYTGRRADRNDTFEDQHRDRASALRRVVMSATDAESTAKTLDELAGTLRREAEQSKFNPYALTLQQSVAERRGWRQAHPFQL